MRALIAGIVGLAVAAIVVLIVGGGSTAGKGIALALFGVACVVAVSAVFLAVGRSEDEERRAAEAARTPPPPARDEDQPAADPHPRPALDRRRPMPPRRPS
jgi:hypothetical protein